MRRIEFWTVKNPLNEFKPLVVVAVNLSSSSARERYAGLTGKTPCMTQPEVLASLSIVSMGQGRNSVFLGCSSFHWQNKIDKPLLEKV